jgi:xanthine dehydrogenase YagS FAD-binding subunit
MQAFEIANPTSTQEAVQLLAGEWGRTEILAGGTDLISLMKDDVATPSRLVSLQRVAQLRGIEFKSGSGLRLGAMATLEQVLDHADVHHHYPGIIHAVDGVRSEQMRNMGTVGGELLQRPRCWFYRGGNGLLAIKDGKSLVTGGDNRYHAILGNSGPAYFVSPSSLGPILCALDAKVKLVGPNGAREVAVEKFFRIPTSDQEREHDIQPNEVLTEILVPDLKGAKTAVYEVREKEALDWPLAAAAVALWMNGSTVSKARVVLGHVAPTPWPSPEAEEALAGKSADAETAAAAGSAAVAKALPLSMNKYKVQLARVAVKRAILRAAKGEAG